MVYSQSAPFSVSQITDLIKKELEITFPSVSVIGEISNFRRQSSGHCYFSLKDESAIINVVIFRGDASRIAFPLKDGLNVVADGEITVYEARGQYQLVARKIRHAGMGDLQARFEALKRKLQNEGLFDATKKRSLPRLPRAVAVITSLSSAALQDFLNVLSRRAPQITIYVLPVSVQGKEAAPAICRALENINRWSRIQMLGVDAVALIRGGGSLEDLWAFNEESVARAIAGCTLPTICGIGHETDITIADLAADVRAPTPSAAAELLCANNADLLDKIESIQRRMRFIIHTRLSNWRKNVERLSSCSVLLVPDKILESAYQRLDDCLSNLTQAMRYCIVIKKNEIEKVTHRLELRHPRNKLQLWEQKLENFFQRLNLLNPRNILKLGYAWVTNADGNLVCSPSQVAHGEKISITLREGVLNAAAVKEEKVRAQN